MAARIAACYLAPLLALTLLGGAGAFWLAGLLALASLPLIFIACIVGFLFARSILSRPSLWAGAALGVSSCSGWLVAGRAGLILGGLIAVPATALFLFTLWQWPLRTP